MNTDLSKKNALVCGSSQGIGLATAIELAELGANVTLLARNSEKLAEAVSKLPKVEGQTHSIIAADFSDSESVKSMVSEALKSQGVFHILVNNTGGPAGGPILKAAPEEFENAMTMHLKTGHLLVQTVVPGMKETGYGRIVNIISTSVKSPIPGLGVSNTTRGAVANWAKTLSYEIASFGITVNNVLPGFTSTSRLDSIISSKSVKLGITEDQVRAQMIGSIPAARFGKPEEVASLVAFLTTPAAGYINGVSVQADGGRTAMH